MSRYAYLDVELKLRDDTQATLTAAFFQGSIEDSLQTLFGEIGGQTGLQLIKFSREKKRAILRVPEEFSTRLNTAITLIGHFQDIPCHFKVNKVSKDLLDF